MIDVSQVREWHEVGFLLVLPVLGAHPEIFFFARSTGIGNEISRDLTAEHSTDIPVSQNHLTTRLSGICARLATGVR